MVKKLIISACVLLAAVSCGSPGKPSAPVYRSFPLPDPAPVMVTGEAERIAYSVNHFWDKYFAEQAVTDSAAVLGVKNDDIEKSFATYVSLLNLVPMDVAVNLRPTFSGESRRSRPRTIPRCSISVSRK